MVSNLYEIWIFTTTKTAVTYCDEPEMHKELSDTHLELNNYFRIIIIIIVIIDNLKSLTL